MRTKVRTRLLKFTMAMEIVMAITILGGDPGQHCTADLRLGGEVLLPVGVLLH